MSEIKSPHDIRRTALTNLFNAGMPLKHIQAIAGHSTLEMTMKYFRLADDGLDDLKFLNETMPDITSCTEITDITHIISSQNKEVL